MYGRHASFHSKAACARSLVAAAHELVRARPTGCSFRVVAAVVWPSMFSSEVCVYSSREYFEEHSGGCGPNRNSPTDPSG
ncbi:MAG: DUF3916 domain-containing protein [Xanthomonadales bacterium]|nr:DUF3916 domain-containing protein [Xanthomonadales bacterium]